MNGIPVVRVVAAALAVLHWAPAVMAAGDAADRAELSVPGLRCVIGGNGAWEAHREGYNGIFLMESGGGGDTPFVPAYAGWNLEHYFDGRPGQEDRKIFFEPRNAPMTFRRVDAATVELHQPETPYWGVESWSRFTLREPHFVDFEFRCTPHKPVQGGFLGCFWASYINAPEDKSIYFLREGATLDAPQWTQFCTMAHNRDSTILPEGDAPEMVFPESGTTLYNSISPLRRGPPLFYGRRGGSVLIFLFEPSAHIRFSHSPSGGGRTAAGDDTNPAWDFQYLIPGAEQGKEYGFRARLVCKPWKDRADVVAEARAFLAGLEQPRK